MTISTPTRIQLKNILVPVDLSRISESAIQLAARVAKHFGAKVTVMHVIDPASFVMAPPEAIANNYEIIRKASEKGTQSLADDLQDIPHDIVIADGDAVEMVLEAIRKNQHDLLVLSTHGRTGLSKLFLGSVSEELFRSADCPVLITGPESTQNRANVTPFAHILYTTDFSKGAQAALPYALSFAQEDQAKLTMLHVLPEDNGQTMTPTDQHLVADMVMGLKRMVSDDAALWCEPNYVVRAGRTGETIVDEAIQKNADLIVMGVRHAKEHLGSSVHLPWTIAHHVIAHAPCPVLAIPSVF